MKSSLLPPFTAALASVIGKRRSDFDTPGHHSGEFFALTEEGRAFLDAFGSQMFDADISDSSSLIGDPSSHEGVSGEAEALAAKAWGSDRCFFVLGGTSASNRIACTALLAEGDLVLFDRNNHKSTYQGTLLAAGARAVYLESERNSQGIIGGLTERSLDPHHLRELAEKISPAAAKRARPFRLACLQLATYDGLFLNAEEILRRLGPLCDYILFDGAWAGYENFLPLLKKSAVLTFDLGKDAPGILVTQSVHKQMAGFSMTSQLHKKDSHLRGEPRYVPDDLLQSAYLSQISTSPYYPLLAGLEMNALLHEKYGEVLWRKAALASIHLKKEILSRCRILRPFLPQTVRNKPWASYADEEILADPAFYSLNEMQSSFPRMAKGCYLLDPCKVLLTTGGAEGGASIPAPFVSAYLEAHGVTAEKSDFYTLLLLNEPGDSDEKGKALAELLVNLETAYEKNRPLSALAPNFGNEGLRDFSRRYADFLKEVLIKSPAGFLTSPMVQDEEEFPANTEVFKGNPDEVLRHWARKPDEKRFNQCFLNTQNAARLQQALFSEYHFPPVRLSGWEAQQDFIKGNRKLIPLAESKGEIALELVLPYPPGIAVLVPGEEWTEDVLAYFLFLESYGQAFPQFRPEILGVHEKDGVPYVWVKA